MLTLGEPDSEILAAIDEIERLEDEVRVHRSASSRKSYVMRQNRMWGRPIHGHDY